MSPADHPDRPLTGLRVLDAATGTLGEIGRQFAELGADVIRLESAGGGADRALGTTVHGVSLDFVAANLGKRAAPLDRLAELASDADLLILPRGLAGPAALRAANPRLVVLEVSDFGDTGRFARWRGSSAVFHALSGELSRSGIPERAPLLPPGDLAVQCAVAQAVFVALLACFEALRSGRGDRLDFSVLDGASQALDPGFGIAGSAAGGVPPRALPPGRPEARHLYPILPCADGFARICLLAPRQWRGMFEWLGRPERFADPEFDKLQVRQGNCEILAAIAELFAEKTRAEIEAEGQRYGVPTAGLLDLDEALASEQMVARRAFRAVDLGGGLDAPFPDGVIEVDGARMGIAGPVPALPDAAVGWRGERLPLRAEGAGERPLSSLKVLDFGVIVVGAEASRLLADYGADVIKVESSAFPDGSRQSRGGELISRPFAAGHRNKRSAAVNLRDTGGKALLLRLIEDTDVLLSNFKGGTLESLGLDYAALKAINPGIVVVDSSAFGPTGPWARRMGYGPLVRASAGLTMQWRYPGEPDSFSDAITVYPDHVAGRTSAIGALALLIRRARTGRGGQVSVSQAEVMLSHMAAPIAARALEQAGHAVRRPAAMSAVYPCRGDDQWCAVTIEGPADERAIARLTGGRPLDEWLLEQEPRSAMEALQAAGVAAGAILRVSERAEFEYWVERGLFRPMSHPHLPIPQMAEGAAVRAERLPDPAERPAPVLGEHTHEVLAERLGMDEAALAAAEAAGAIEQWRPAAPDDPDQSAPARNRF